MKTLVVDDDRISNKLLKALLESKTNKIEIAEDGEQAMDKLNQNVFDLIISDVQMPKLDGFTMILRIRDNPGLKHIPVILYSAFYTSDNFEKLAMQSGANKFIRKNGSTQDIVLAAKVFINKVSYAGK
jgi:CheY-like chemotaxis protein